jgi:3-isopropylmalate dehydrogenase
VKKTKYQIAVIPGDGTGPELTAEGLKVLKAAQETKGGFQLNYTHYELSARLYLRTKEIIPVDEFDGISKSDAIVKGPIGLYEARHPDGTELSQDNLLRTSLDMWANVRPIKLRPGATTVLKGIEVGDIDYVVVRENSEGLYSAWAISPEQAKYAPLPSGLVMRNEVAVDLLMVTRSATERICKYAFELAKRRNGCPQDGIRKVTCVDKANVLKSFAFFRKIYDQVAENYPEINKDYAYCDAMTQWQIRRPGYFDVVVAENMFGDIITDLAAATVGSVGMGPGANIGDKIAMFEPIHGSAPKYAGLNVVNPIGMILSMSMMLDWLGIRNENQDTIKAGKLIEDAVDAVLAEGKVRTKDLGGTSKTSQVGDAIVMKMQELSR